MENKSHALAAGAFVLAMLALLIGLAVWLTRDNRVLRLYSSMTVANPEKILLQAPSHRRASPCGPA